MKNNVVSPARVGWCVYFVIGVFISFYTMSYLSFSSFCILGGFYWLLGAAFVFIRDSTRVIADNMGSGVKAATNSEPDSLDKELYTIDEEHYLPGGLWHKNHLD